MNRNKKTLKKKILGWTLGSLGVLGTATAVVGSLAFKSKQEKPNNPNLTRSVPGIGNQLVDAPIIGNDGQAFWVNPLFNPTTNVFSRTQDSEYFQFSATKNNNNWFLNKKSKPLKYLPNAEKMEIRAQLSVLQNNWINKSNSENRLYGSMTHLYNIVDVNNYNQNGTQHTNQSSTAPYSLNYTPNADIKTMLKNGVALAVDSVFPSVNTENNNWCKDKESKPSATTGHTVTHHYIQTKKYYGVLNGMCNNTLKNNDVNSCKFERGRNSPQGDASLLWGEGAINAATIKKDFGSSAYNTNHIHANIYNESPFNTKRNHWKATELKNNLINTFKTQIDQQKPLRVKNKVLNYESLDFSSIYGDRFQTTDIYDSKNDLATMFNVTLFNGNQDAAFQTIDKDGRRQRDYYYNNVNQVTQNDDSVYRPQNSNTNRLSADETKGRLDANQNRNIEGDAEQRLENVWMDFSNLFEIKHADQLYQTNGEIFKDQTPKIEIGFNEKLMLSLYEEAQIATLIKDTFIGDEQNNKFNDWMSNNSKRKVVFEFLQDVYTGRVGLNKTREYIEKYNEGNYSYISPSNSAEYARVLEQYGFENEKNISSINEQNIAQALEQILNRGFIWKYIIPSFLLNNDIYVTTQQKGLGVGGSVINEKEIHHKVWDRKTQKFNAIEPKDTGIQIVNESNRIQITLTDIYLSPYSAESFQADKRRVGIGKNGANNKTLNFENLARNVQQPKSARSSDKNYKLTSDNNLEFEFMYNSKKYWEGTDTPVQNGYSLTTWDDSASEMSVVGGFDQYAKKESLVERINQTLDIPAAAATDYSIPLGDWTKNQIYSTSEDLDLVSGSRNAQAVEQLRTFLQLQENYLKLVKNGNDVSTAAQYEEYLKAKYELDKLGYIYLTVSTPINLEYYYENTSVNGMNKLFEDGSIIPLSKKEQKDGMNKYAVQIESLKKPLDINKLADYIKIQNLTTTKEEPEILKIEKEFSTYQQKISDAYEFRHLLLAEVDKQLNEYNSLIDLKQKTLSKDLNDNLEYKKDVAKIDELIKNQKALIAKRYNQEMNPGSKLIGVHDVVNNEFDLSKEFSELRSLLNQKIKTLQYYYKLVDADLGIDLDQLNQNIKAKKYELDRSLVVCKNSVTELKKLSTELIALKKPLETYNTLTRSDNTQLVFNLDAMKADANWDWDTVLSGSGSWTYNTQDMIQDGTFWERAFYVTKYEAIRFINDVLAKNNIDTTLDATIFDNDAFVDQNKNYSNFIYDETLLTPVINNVSYTLESRPNPNTKELPSDVFLKIDGLKQDITFAANQWNEDIKLYQAKINELSMITEDPNFEYNFSDIRDIKNTINQLDNTNSKLFVYSKELNIGVIVGIVLSGIATVTGSVLLGLRNKLKKGTKVVKASKSETEAVEQLNKSLK